MIMARSSLSLFNWHNKCSGNESAPNGKVPFRSKSLTYDNCNRCWFLALTGQGFLAEQISWRWCWISLLVCLSWLSVIVRWITTENVFLGNFAFFKTVGVRPWGWFVILNKRLTAILAWGNGTRPAQPNSTFLIVLALGHARGERMYSR